MLPCTAIGRYAAAAAAATAAAPSALLPDLCCCTVTMANAAVASWSACIKELQQLAAGSATSPDAAQLAVDRLDKDKQSPLPSAAWKKLVRNVKVLL